MGSAQLNAVVVASRNAARFRGEFEATVSFIERVIDLMAVAIAVLLAYSAYFAMGIGKQLHYSFSAVLTSALVFALVFVFMLDYDGAYKKANSLLRIRETERILRVSIQSFGIALPVSFFLSYLFSRWIVVLAMIFVPVTLVIEKQLVFLTIRFLHSRGYGVQNVLVYGAGFTGRSVYSALFRSPKLGLHPVAFVDDDETIAGREIFGSGYEHKHSVPVIVGPLSAGLIRKHGCRLIVVGIPSLTRQRLQEIAAEASEAGAEVAFVPELTFGSETSTDFVNLDGVLIASLGQPVRKSLYEAVKRIFDVSAAFILIVVTALFCAIVAALIRWESEGPVFFRQTRVGREGKLFELYKFRSMCADAAKYALHPTEAEDPRITRIGRWLRRTSFDELPQLINVLKGDMSLVGPRPEMPFIVERYSARHRERLQVIPGLTGLWQLSADRSFLIHENIQYDLYYIRNRNFFMDLAILLHTVAFAMRGV